MKRLYILMLTINIHASYTSHTFDSIPMSSIGSFFYGVLSLPVYGAQAIFSIYEELENWKYTSQCAARWAKTYPLQCCLGAFGMGALYNKLVRID